MEKITGFLIAESTRMCLNVNCSMMGVVLRGLNSFQRLWWEGKHDTVLAISKANIN